MAHKQKKNRLVSIIIPCYNQGMYLEETLNSVFAQTYENIEVILVDDGSTDPCTIEKMQTLKHEKLSIYRTKNQGVSAARNYAIAASKGDYILPLDGDDKIAPEYVEKAMAVMVAANPFTVVYCEAAVFGKQEMKWPLPEFSPVLILRENMIFCSALFSRKLFRKIGGYNANMVTGWEDWDFWLSAVEHGAQFIRLPQILFYYRMVQKSRNASLDLQKMKSMYAQLFRNHSKLFTENIEAVLDDYLELKEAERYNRNRLWARVIRKIKKILSIKTS